MMHDKHKALKIVEFAVIAALAIFLVYGILNYRILEKDITKAVEIWGFGAMFVLCFILESLPFVIGPNAPLIAAFAIGLNPAKIILVLYIAVVLSGIIGFYSGKKFSYYVERIIHQERMEKYESCFRKYGAWIGVLSAVAFIPYIPALLGIFNLSQKHFWLVVMPLRIVKFAFTLAVLFWFFGLV